jgi:hypothetical protein
MSYLSQRFRAALPLLLVLTLALAAPPVLRALVISEIHYHPPVGQEALEFIEISSDSSTPEDISGYSFAGGVTFQFPAGTILQPGGIVVVCADVEAMKAHYGIQNVVGNFTGKLDNGGESIKIANQAGIVLQSVHYNDRGKWPAAPDGTGHTLALRSLHLDPGEPESWIQSAELGGSPGRPNFSGGPSTTVDETLVAVGEVWKYQKGTQPFSTPETDWREPGHDDSAWLEGTTGFGYGDNDDSTVLNDMQNSYSSVACRKRFSVSAGQLAGPGDFFLGIDFDDGFCAYLNGAELARTNCGAAGTDMAWNAIATGSHEAGTEELHPIPRDLLRAGENVLAIAGYNFSLASSDFSLIPRVFLRRARDTAGPPTTEVSLNELYRGAQAGKGWVEIYNPHAAAVDLSGYRLTDDPARASSYLLPSGSVVAPHGFLKLDETQTLLALSLPEIHLFLTGPDGLVAAASVFDRLPPPGLGPGDYSEVRFPDGGPLDWVTRTPTPGSPNQVERTTAVVINEIFYNPPEGRRGEFVELYNRGSAAVDVSGFSFDKGINYTFEPGTVMAPGGYLVVTDDPALMAQNYGYLEAKGPFLGQLSNGGESLRLADRWGNPVNEVRYRDGGSWPKWADGGGSSLELIDPAADNSLAAAWDSSDETAKGQWEQLSFHVPAYVPTGDSELHLYLIEAGICHLDDVSISRAAGANLIPNPGFETSTTPWVIQGTHVLSHRIQSDSHTGSACLEVIASAKGDTLVNRLEVDTSPAMTAGPYDVSLWARWQRGTSLLIAHGEFSAGPYGARPSPAVNLSGNTLAARLRMTIPMNLGTPGEENSVRRRLREETGSGNLGPLIADVSHRPASPAAADPAVVTARVVDPDGVGSVKAFYRAGSANGVFSSIDLLDDGLHGDGEPGDGIYGGQIPPFPNGTKVVFYIEAADLPGALRRFPLEAPGKTCLYQVQGPLQDRLDTSRLILDDARTAELQNRPLHSNDLLDGTFVFNNDEVYYNIGVRYRGSPWGRPSRALYRVRFESDHPFHRGQADINLSSRGSAPNEGMCYFLIGRDSAPGIPVPTEDYAYCKMWFNGASAGTYGILQPVDMDYLKKWFGPNANGPVLKAVGRIAFNDGGALAGWDGASYIHMGLNSENYRGYFVHSVNQTLDNWDPLFALTKVMDKRQTPDLAFDAQIDSILNVEAFLRVIAPRVLMSDWDAFSIGNGHNGYLVFDERDSRWQLIPFDEDNTFSNPAPNLFGSSDDSVVRLLGRPGPRRTYYRILWEYLAGYWSAATAGPFLDAVQAASGLGTGGIKGYISTSAASVRSMVLPFTNIPFRITTNGGNEVNATQATILLEGDVPVQVATILYQRNDGDVAPLQGTWSTPTHWKATFDLPDRDNLFLFLGFDSSGTLLYQKSIMVHTGIVFLRGDSNRDQALDLGDALKTLFYLFLGDPLPCVEAADANDDGKVNISDSLGILEYLFLSGPPPAAPFPAAGVDPTPDGLGCTG